tara:strand:- start:396 stop:650 length:255 start_codon:yes stop_codon:yes gene_type:complete
MRVAEKIEKKIFQELKPTRFELIDESHLHAGHVGARPEGETHFRLSISAQELSGKSLLDKQRRIYKILKEELEGPVHALSIEAD